MTPPTSIMTMWPQIFNQEMKKLRNFIIIMCILSRKGDRSKKIKEGQGIRKKEGINWIWIKNISPSSICSESDDFKLYEDTFKFLTNIPCRQIRAKKIRKPYVTIISANESSASEENNRLKENLILRQRTWISKWKHGIFIIWERLSCKHPSL